MKKNKNKKSPEQERADYEKHLRERSFWNCRYQGKSLGGDNRMRGHHRTLEDLDRADHGVGFSLDHSTGLLTLEWRRGSSGYGRG